MIQIGSRLKQILTYVELIAEQQPSLRFNQLIDILQHEFNFANGYKYNGGYIHNFGTKKNPSYTELTKLDLFNLEDDLFLEFLKKVYIKGFSDKGSGGNINN
ncbi:hypothetical protein ACI2JA_03390 [Alkalihalobacillus sp. NPDC078783]